MKYISEEKLRELQRQYANYESIYDMEQAIGNLLNECTELTPFYPIDENTPKDRFLLLYSPGIGGVSRKFVGKLESCWYWNPTHWCELQEDPK